MRVTANGYAIHLKRSDVQQAVADLTQKFSSMLDDYAGRDQYPINSPVEIRVTGLDDPTEVGISPTPDSPLLSALGMDATDRQNGWDVALWFDVLTIPGTPHANEFYRDLEQWIVGGSLCGGSDDAGMVQRLGIYGGQRALDGCRVLAACPADPDRWSRGR